MDQPLAKQDLDRKILIKKLIQGRELVKELKIVLDKPFGGDNGYAVANDLISRISGSFTGLISMMDKPPEDNIPEKAPENLPDDIPDKTPEKLLDICGQKEGSHKNNNSIIVNNSNNSTSNNNNNTSNNNNNTIPIISNPRGCYKRRKKMQTSTKLVPTLIDDGHAWRKYGQKVIRNAEEPRNYFRCTHKYDQGCQATKQVQKTQTEPHMYQIIYHGKHTCTAPQNPPLIYDTANPDDGKFILSFDSSKKSHHGPTFPSFMNQEHNPNIVHNKSTPPDLHKTPELTAVGSSGSLSVLSSGESDQDVERYQKPLDAAQAIIDFICLENNAMTR